MHNKKLKFFLFFIASLFSISAFAATWHSSYIRTIYPLANGNFVLIPETPNTQCSGIASNQYFYVQVGINGITEKGIDKIYAAVLAAHIAKKRVSYNFNEASSSCDINRLFVAAD